MDKKNYVSLPLMQLGPNINILNLLVNLKEVKVSDPCNKGLILMILIKQLSCNR